MNTKKPALSGLSLCSFFAVKLVSFNNDSPNNLIELLLLEFKEKTNESNG